MIEISLPIYFTQEFKTKDSKTFLVGMNWYRNAHHYLQNQVKKHYAELVWLEIDKLGKALRIEGQYTLEIELYYKNSSCDGSNIFAMMEKFTLDALQDLNMLEQDNVKYHLGTHTKVIEQDKHNPRVIIKVKKVKNE